MTCRATPNQIRRRNCLRCKKEFMSYQFGVRLCVRCRDEVRYEMPTTKSPIFGDAGRKSA